MPIQHYYAGPAVVEVAVRNGVADTLSAYTQIGINRESIPIVIQPRFLDVPSDDWAGTDGAPADAQFMGAIATVQLSLTKVEVAWVDRLLDGLLFATNTAGTTVPFGSFIRQGNLMFALKLNSVALAGKTDEKVMTFPYCFVRGGGAVGQGTRYSSYDLTVEAWMNSSTTRQLYTVAYG